jgi:NTP pyrophosphatase (non-canonical NTP hydrolase)
MTLEELQATVDGWITEHGGYWDRFQIMARLAEELGEVASALQRTEGLRPHKTEVDLEGEIGDLLFTLAAFANVNNLSLSASIDKTMDKYQVRDSQAWKKLKNDK